MNDYEMHAYKCPIMYKWAVTIEYFMVGCYSEKLGVGETPMEFCTVLEAENHQQAEDLAVGQLVRKARALYENDSINIEKPTVMKVVKEWR